MKNLTLRQLKTVQAVCKFGKITSAAKELGLTSPALTIQIQQMEEAVGLALFDRTKRGMIPTEVGHAYLQTAQLIHGHINALEDQIAAIKGLKTGRLRLGVVSTGKYFAPKMMVAFMKAQPGVELQLFIGNRAETIAKLRNFDIDIALMGRPPRDFEVRAQIFGDHPLVFIAPNDHVLSSKLDISKERLTQEHFIVREKGSGTRTSLEIFMGELHGNFGSVSTEMDSNETIKQAVIAGLGIAFISAHTIEQELKLKSLHVLDVVETPIRRQWFSVSRVDHATTPAMAVFEEFLRRKGSKYLPLVTRTYRANSSA